MLTAEVGAQGEFHQLAAERQVTRLGASVFAHGFISPEAQALVLENLRRYQETIQRWKPDAVRAVATSATRDASNQAEFLEAATRALGYPVEVISGREESRLIQLGVRARWPHPGQRVLIIDVGGGSAELIIADRGELAEAFSKPLGAVRLTQTFLKNDPATTLQLRQMEEFIDEKIATTLPALEKYRVDRVIGTSATAAAVISAVNKIVRADREKADGLRASIADIRDLYKRISLAPHAQRYEEPGIGPRRAEIIVAGAAVILRVLEKLELSSIYFCNAGVREGIIADLATRAQERGQSSLDAAQRRAVEALVRKFDAGLRHARHVAGIAAELFRQTSDLHKLDPADGRLVEAAAYLLDVGHYISDSAHHKHSYYVIANSDLEGFTSMERELIALLCRYHRKSMPQSRHEPFERLPGPERQRLLKLIPLIRAADALDQSQEQAVDSVRVKAKNHSIQIALSSSRMIDLETWALERTSPVFEQVYGKPLEVTRGNGHNGSSSHAG